ncbi:hypothetical protein BT93_E2049 [Corymbia citriodora subsp. variegata]|nr:hypothetical protein BT93_E2049 [Corymbia citriodora subsp. variegata]
MTSTGSWMLQIKSGLWIHPRVPDFVEKVELGTLAKTYGKFWCTWQVDQAPDWCAGADDVTSTVRLGLIEAGHGDEEGRPIWHQDRPTEGDEGTSKSLSGTILVLISGHETGWASRSTSCVVNETSRAFPLNELSMQLGTATATNLNLSMESKAEFVEGKVDWKGRKALKHKHGGMRVSLLILGAFSFESLATLALAVNLVTYFNGVMHFELADAANQLTNFMGTTYILSILAATLADAFIGRFKTVLISASIKFLTRMSYLGMLKQGLALLTVQAHYPKLRPSLCNVFNPTSHCEKISGGNAAILFLGLYLLATGSAGMKASLPAHGADQFDERDPQEARQMSSFFNCLLLAVCTGGMASLTLFVWVQDNKGWDWGFGLSTFAMILAIIIFAAGLPLYRIQIVQKSSAIIEIIQVYVAAISKRDLQLPEEPTELYELDKDGEEALEAEFLPHTANFRFLERAAIQTTTPEQYGGAKAPNPWFLCRVTQVENAKIILGMVPIFCCTIIMTLCLAQLQTFSIQQRLTMDTSITSSFHIPPASLPIIPIAFLIIIVPVYDQVFVPFARKLTGHPAGITHLQRIGVSLVLSSISMAVAAAIEVKRKAVARNHHMLDAIPVLQPLPIRTFWLSFQFFIFGITDMFTYVGLLEFFYSEAPKGLKSVSTCFLWSSMALGYFFSTIMVKIVNGATKGITRSGGWLAGNNINRNHLNLFYLLLSMLSLINFCVYLFVARRYKYRTKSPMKATPCEEARDCKVEESN